MERGRERRVGEERAWAGEEDIESRPMSLGDEDREREGMRMGPEGK